MLGTSEASGDTAMKRWTGSLSAGSLEFGRGGRALNNHANIF